MVIKNYHLGWHEKCDCILYFFILAKFSVMTPVDPQLVTDQLTKTCDAVLEHLREFQTNCVYKFKLLNLSLLVLKF